MRDIVHYFISIFCFILLLSCSSVTKNMVKKGKLGIPGGVMNDREWREVLELKRVSWFKELTLTYDIVYTAIDKTSPFYAWFSPSEKKKVDSCAQTWLFYTYTIDSRKVSDKDILKQLKDQGFDVFAINHFHNQLRMHANFEYLSMQVYKPQALCRRFMNSSEVSLNVPGFKSIDLK